MKGILLILDGMHDNPLSPLGEKPPFEAPALKTLTALKKLGVSGSLLTTPPGHSPDTRTGILTLLGTPPGEIPKGRAYLEALSAGVPVGEEDGVFRCNLVQVDTAGRILSPNDAGLAPDLIREATAAIAALAAHCGLGFTHLAGYRSLLTLPGGRSAAQQAENPPPHQSIGNSLINTQENLVDLSDKLKTFTELKSVYLSRFPGISFALWDGSVKTILPSLKERLGREIALVSATPIVLGMGKMLALSTVTPVGATGETDTDLPSKCTAALTLLQNCDGVVLHVNGADEAAHRRNVQEKCSFLQRVDTELLPALWSGLKTGERLLITSDHASYAATGAHGGGPQPFLLLEKGRTLSQISSEPPSILPGTTGCTLSGTTGCRPSGTTGCILPGTTGCRPSGTTGCIPPGTTGCRPSGTTGCIPPGTTGCRPSGTTGCTLSGTTGCTFSGTTGCTFSGTLTLPLLLGLH